MAVHVQVNSGTSLASSGNFTGKSGNFGSIGNTLKNSVSNFYEKWLKPTAHSAVDAVTSPTTVGGQVKSVNLGDFVNGVSANPDVLLDDSKLHDLLDEVSRNPDVVIDDILDGAPTSRGASYSSVRPVTNSASSLDYMYADLAKHYKMDAKAAYSEALQNTAYQRAVADLKRAGLNPVLAAGNVSPSGSFAAGNTLSGGSGSGSSGGYGAPGSAKYALSSDAYNLLGVVGLITGAVIGSKTTPGSPMLGASSGAMLMKQAVQGAAQGVSSMLNMRK